MSQVVGLPNNSYKPITNTAWVRTRLCKLQKGCTCLAAASDKIYQLLAHGRWFSHSTKASSTTKTGRHDIAEILLKVVLSTKDQSINQSINLLSRPFSSLSKSHNLTVDRLACACKTCNSTFPLFLCKLSDVSFNQF